MAEGSIAMMGGAYFVSKSELLDWLNTNFSLNYSKVEQCCTGAAHCQVLDAIFPGTLAMERVVWDARSEYQYVNNFKLLQKCLDKNSVKKRVDVERVTKGRYQDNLELFQWIKAFFDQQKGELDEDYDPVVARSASASAVKMDKAAGGSVTAALKTSKPSRPSAGGGGGTIRKLGAPTGGSDKRVAELEAALADAEAKNEEDAINIENLLKERDFYFKKLRDIEILCQQQEEPKSELCQDITEVLYAVDEGFSVPEEAADEGETADDAAAA